MHCMARGKKTSMPLEYNVILSFLHGWQCKSELHKKQTELGSIHLFIYLSIHLIVYSFIHPSAGLRNSLGLQTSNGGPRAGPRDQTRPVWRQKEQPVPDLAGHGRLESCSRRTETSQWLHWYFVGRKLCDQFLYPPHTPALPGQCVGCVRKQPPANKVNKNWNSKKHECMNPIQCAH